MPNPGDEELDLESIGSEIDAETSDPAAGAEQEEVVDPAADETTQDAEAESEGKGEKPEGASSDSSEIEVAGRKYKDQAALMRAHDHVYRQLSKIEKERSSERKELEQFRSLTKLWQEHPDLFKSLKSAEAKYFEAREAGATHAEAKAVSRTSNVPHEVMQQLKELREWKQSRELREQAEEAKAEEARLNGEFTNLRAKYKLDDAAVDAVSAIMLERAEAGEEISSQYAYEIMLVRQNRMARTELERTRAAADTGSTGGSSPKVPRKSTDTMTDAEFNAEMERQLQNLPD
jgi:hypothetical protein